MLRIEDAHLPGLAELTQDQLRKLTGAEEVELLRLRYRAGERAILHIAARTGDVRNEGTLWFFKGDKAQRLARRNKKTARFDADAQVLFEAFPNDHRMPQIKAFLDDFKELIPQLTGYEAAGTPQLLRYRPGLSCTFRCPLQGYSDAFVKLVNDDDPVQLFASNRIMQGALAGSDVRVAKALGVNCQISAIAYEAAPGIPLDKALVQSPELSALTRSMAALQTFWQAPIMPERQMGPDQLLLRAREAANFVAVTAPDCAGATASIVAGLEVALPQSALLPIHGDIKLEHLFLDADRASLIDMESVSMGLPDYDLAQLYGRLWQAEVEGQLPRTTIEAASDRVRAGAGPNFEWCLGVVAARLAKYFAQRPVQGMSQTIMAILERLR